MNARAATRCPPGKHTFRGGGTSKTNRDGMAVQYMGKCCGGEKLPGDAYGRLWKCTVCPHTGYVCGWCRKELKLDDGQEAVVKTNKATACAVKRGELERDGPTPWALSKFVHATTQAKRSRGTAISEEDELDVR